jgi:hypothetical protein
MVGDNVIVEQRSLWANMAQANVVNVFVGPNEKWIQILTTC